MFKIDLRLPESWDGSISVHGPALPMYAPHRHDELELNLVTAGRAAYLVGDRRYELAHNTLVWLFPDQDHVLLDRSPDHRMWIGLFKPSLLGRFCAGSGGQPDPERAVLREAAPPGTFCRRLADADARRLDALLAEIHAVRGDTPWLNAGLGYVLLSAWAAYLAADEAATGSGVHPAVERTARLLRDDPDAPTLDRMAATEGLSAGHLGRLFHQQTGVTVVDFRNRQRIQRFLAFYGDGRQASALDAALEAGFGSYAQFHRVFTRQMGRSPAAYRRGLAAGGTEAGEVGAEGRREPDSC